MTTYEQDPDVIEWGLQFFDDDGGMFYNIGCDNISRVEMPADHRLCYGMDNYDRECRNFENDQLIAYALQQELSQLEVKEELVPIVLEEEDDIGLSSSFSSPDENLYVGIDSSCSSELTDEYALYREVGKKLNMMVSIPLYELVELKVQGDGNFQFQVLSDKIYRTLEHHKFVRDNLYIRFGEWRDHVTLKAAPDSDGVFYIEIVPNNERSKTVICLSFWAEVHYNSIYPGGDVLIMEATGKKR